MVAVISAPPRLRREDCHRTNHDSIFSKWQVLVGASDWEDYTSRKEGSERYRTHNLPTTSCPGIYELGVADTHTSKGREIRKLDTLQIIVVYVGQADSVRTRLQHYGRAGSHLDHGNSVPIVGKKDCFQRRPGLFKEIFARGFSIVYRWAPMKSKEEAEMAEGLLLGVFDYAWNRIANGSCRRDDVLLKLESISLVANPFTRILRKLHFFKIQTFNRKRVGIKIEASGQLEGAVGSSTTRKCDDNEIDGSGPRICGATMTDGSVCRNKPVSGRKRCLDHKGMRIKTSRQVSGAPGAVGSSSTRKCDDNEIDGSGPRICGVTMTDGSVCRNKPVSGRERCLDHKGKRIKTSRQVSSAPENRLLKEDEKEPETVRNCNVRHAITSGAALEDDSVCKEAPFDGRKRCQKPRGRRISKPQAA